MFGSVWFPLGPTKSNGLNGGYSSTWRCVLIYGLREAELAGSYCRDKSLCSCYDHFLKVPKPWKVRLWDALHILLGSGRGFVVSALGSTRRGRGLWGACSVVVPTAHHLLAGGPE